jgi:hypothetical protein
MISKGISHTSVQNSTYENGNISCIQSGKTLACDGRGQEFKFRVLCLLLFHDDILGSLGSNPVFIIPFGIK